MEVTSFVAYTIFAIVALGVYFDRAQVATIFTQDEIAIKLLTETMPFMVIFFLLDASQAYLQGPVRAFGLQG